MPAYGRAWRPSDGASDGRKNRVKRQAGEASGLSARAREIIDRTKEAVVRLREKRE